VASTSCEPSFW